MIWVLIILLLAGCIEKQEQIDPILKEFNNSYYENIISYWEKAMDGKEYNIFAYEKIGNLSSIVIVNVSNESYNIIHDLYGDESIIYYGYKNDNEKYCVRVLKNYLSCLESKELFSAIYRDFGGNTMFSYINNKKIPESEKNYIDSLLKVKTLIIQKQDDRWLLSYNLNNMSVEELISLGYKISDISIYDNVDIEIIMSEGNYNINIIQNKKDGGKVIRNILVNISLVGSFGEFPLNIENYNRIDSRLIIEMIKNLILIKEGYYKQEEIYKLAAKTRTPEYCLYSNNTNVCISFYVETTGDKRACDIVGVEC